jgi:hypothetical protein
MFERIALLGDFKRDMLDELLNLKTELEYRDVPICFIFLHQRNRVER